MALDLLYPLSVKRWLCFLIILMTAMPVGASTGARVVSFKIWKQNKVDEAKSLVAELKREMRRVSNPKTPDEEEERGTLVRRINQAELNLGVARDLSANDYFVLYVAPQFKDNPDALRAAAKTLNSKDVADILGSYERRLETPPPSADEDKPAGLYPSAL